jgi:hypothetical protein
LLRKLNLIVYLEKDYNPDWGGSLEFWSHDSETNKPKEKITQSSEYQRFCWEVTKLKQLTDKMQRREIESVCEEIAEIAPTYVLI